MEEEHIFSAEQLVNEEETSKTSGGVNKVLLGIIVVLLLLITGGGAYYLGNKFAPGEEGRAIPTTQPLLNTETLGEETETASEDAETTLETEITPTTDPPVTPSVTPEVTLTPFKPNLKTDIKVFATPPTEAEYVINEEVQILP